MAVVSVEVCSPVQRGFRVEQVAGMTDVALPKVGEVVTRRFCVEWPGIMPAEAGKPLHWTVGAVVGPSGSGKGKVTRAMIGDDFLEVGPGAVSSFDWPSDRPVIDGFAAEVSGERISAMFQAVGFSDAPAWLLPWCRLSTGQRWRADLARALMQEREVVGVDEFGAMVSEAVAKVGAIAVSKAVRKGRAGCRRVVLVGAKGVGAGGDVGEGWLRWAEPDWWVDMETGALHLRG